MGSPLSRPVLFLLLELNLLLLLQNILINTIHGTESELDGAISGDDGGGVASR